MKTLTVCLMFPMQAQPLTSIESWNLDRERAGVIAPTFTNEAGDWKVVADNDAPSKLNVLAQLAASSGPTFHIALAVDTSYRDVD